MQAICSERRGHWDVHVGERRGWQNLSRSCSLGRRGVYLQVDDGLTVGMRRVINCACIASLLGERTPTFAVKHVLYHMIITSYLVLFLGQNFLSEFPAADLF